MKKIIYYSLELSFERTGFTIIQIKTAVKITLGRRESLQSTKTVMMFILLLVIL